MTLRRDLVRVCSELDSGVCTFNGGCLDDCGHCGASQVLALFEQKIEGLENPYDKDLATFKEYSTESIGFACCRHALLELVKEGNDEVHNA